MERARTQARLRALRRTLAGRPDTVSTVTGARRGHPRLATLRRALTRQPTEPSPTAATARLHLWMHLRGRRLGVRFCRRRPLGTQVLDFVCPERRLVLLVTVPGERRAFGPRACSFRVLHLTAGEVLHDTPGVLGTIRAALRATTPRRSRRHES